MTTDASLIPFYGMYRGHVVNNADPEGLYRITATCPQVFGDETVETAWAWPCFPSGYTSLIAWAETLKVVGLATLVSPYAGEGPIPVCGAGVYLSFLGGDVNNPLWHGVWQVGV